MGVKILFIAAIIIVVGILTVPWSLWIFGVGFVIAQCLIVRNYFRDRRYYLAWLDELKKEGRLIKFTSLCNYSGGIFIVQRDIRAYQRWDVRFTPKELLRPEFPLTPEFLVPPDLQFHESATKFLLVDKIPFWLRLTTLQRRLLQLNPSAKIEVSWVATVSYDCDL